MRHGSGRSPARHSRLTGRWFQPRKAIRETCGLFGAEALADQWVRYETAVREKAMSAAVEYIDKYVEKLQAGEVSINTKDMLGMVAMLRTLMSDASAAKTTEEVLLDPDTAELHPDEYRRALATIDQLEAGTLNGAGHGADDAEAPAAAGPSGAGED